MKTARILGRLAAPILLTLAEIWLACAASLIVTTPAAAQFMDFPFWGRRQAPQHERSPWRGWQSSPEPRQQQIDASKAPPARKQEGAPAKTVVVLGDSMADWLGFGLEDAFAETPEIGVSRKYRTYSGLIRGESRKEVDWPQVAKEILAAEKADFIVMMIGMNDRQSIRERPPRVVPKQQPAAQSKLEGAQPTQIGTSAGQQPADAQEAAAAGEQPKAPEQQKPAAAPEPAAPMVTYEFRSEKWGEAYGRRIDETIAVLKSKGVPVLWVGLPALRGTRTTAEIAYLNELYRGHAEKSGAVYVDVWDGFVDESGSFAPRGPDFEGQIRVLRAGDGVHFTKAGARKLAHYVEREIRHVMLSRGAPMALPSPEEPQPDASRPGSSAARPASGPVVPLTTMTNAPEGLLGANAQRPGMADPNANRVLVKGEPLLSISGRADDFAWPRPEVSLQPAEPEPSAPPARPSAGKPSTAGSPTAPKPAGPTPARKQAPAASAAAEESRRPLSIDERPRAEPTRRRASPDNALRPPAAVPLAPIH